MRAQTWYIHSALKCVAAVLQLLLLLHVILLVSDVYQSLLSRKLLVFRVGLLQNGWFISGFRRTVQEEKEICSFPEQLKHDLLRPSSVTRQDV